MLTEPQKKQLRRLAHARKVIVQTGNAGLSDAVIKEIDHALEHHELVKIRVVMDDRKDREAAISKACETLGADLVQRIGHVATLYRANPEKEDRIILPT
jgi:RNA-binding protein